MLSQPTSVPDTPSLPFLLLVPSSSFQFLCSSPCIHFTSFHPDGCLESGMSSMVCMLSLLRGQRGKCCSSPCLCGCVPHGPVRAKLSSACAMCPFPPQQKWGHSSRWQERTVMMRRRRSLERYQLPLSFPAAWHSNYILKLGIQRNCIPWLWCHQLVQKNLNKWDFSACCRSCCLLRAVKEVFQVGCVGQRAIPALLTGSLALLSVSILDK